MFGGNGIVESQTFDEATVTTIAGVGDDQIVKGALLGAAARKTNDDHCLCPVGKKKRGRLYGGNQEIQTIA
jgi:hypothetical protein